jgi:ribosome-associated protein
MPRAGAQYAPSSPARPLARAPSQETRSMQILEFDLDGDYVELKQLLKLADLVTSGGEAKMVIGDGQVRVDGEVELRKACKIRAGQVVEFADSQIRVLAAG